MSPRLPFDYVPLTGPGSDESNSESETAPLDIRLGELENRLTYLEVALNRLLHLMNTSQVEDPYAPIVRRTKDVEL